MRKLLFLTALMMGYSLHAQITPQWSLHFGGSQMDVLQKACYGKEGHYALFGFTKSSNHDLTQNFGNEDAWILVLDSAGNKLFSRNIGGSASDYGQALIQRADSLYLMLINTYSSGSADFPVSYGGCDFWIKGMDKNFNISSGLHLGGSATDYAYDIKPSNNNGFVVCGMTNSTDSIFSGHLGGDDGFVVRVSPTSQLLWAHCYGSKMDDQFTRIIPRQAGNFVCYGNAENGTGNDDLWLVDISSTGTFTHQVKLSGDSSSYAMCATYVNDSLMFAGGFTHCTTGDFSGNTDNTAAFLFPFQNDLTHDTMIFFTGNGMEMVTDMIPYHDSLLIVSIVSTSTNGQFAGNYGMSDLYIAILNKNLSVAGIHHFGGSYLDAVYESPLSASFLTPEGALVVASNSESANHNLPGNYGLFDGWAMKLDPEAFFAKILEINPVPSSILIYPNPASDELVVTLGEISQCSIILYDLAGNQVRRWENCGNINRLNVKALPSGMYLMNISDGQQTYSEKVLISR